MSEERQADKTTAENRQDPNGEYAWFRDGSLPHSREDFMAEAVALLALLFAIGLGLVISMLPMTAAAAPAPAAPSRELSDYQGAAGSVESTLTGPPASGAAGTVSSRVKVS